jgi:hypothetical protein
VRNRRLKTAKVDLILHVRAISVLVQRQVFEIFGSTTRTYKSLRHSSISNKNKIKVAHDITSKINQIVSNLSRDYTSSSSYNTPWMKHHDITLSSFNNDLRINKYMADDFDNENDIDNPRNVSK